jgi:putative ABC transport system ATP-binding protein
MANPALTMVGISKTYERDGRQVPGVRDVRLEVLPGEMVAVVGRSGSGKSTLLSIAGLLMTPDSGRIAVGGVDVGQLDDAARTQLRRDTIGFVFQAYNLVPQLSALENVALVHPQGIGVGRNRAQKLLAEFGLSGRLDHGPAELSGGEQQRVALARAMMNEPRLILADEPTGNLDAESEAVILDLFRRSSATGVSVVLVTHSAQVAEQADRSIRMDRGRIITDDFIETSQQGGER